MEVYQAEQFLEIAKCGTMREAAEKLYVSQPTLSYNLKKLESELGCQLFTRVHNQLRLTGYGEAVLEHAEKLMADWREMLRAIEDLKRREAATLHVGCFSPIAASFIMPQIAAELRDWSFDVVCCPTDELAAGLDDGRFDILIATEICRKKPLRWRELYSERAYLSAPRDAVPAKLEAAHGPDLAHEAYAIESGMPGYSDWFAYVLRNAGVEEAAVQRIPFKEHLRTKDMLPSCHLITSFIMGYVKPAETRAIVPIDEPYARRSVGLLFKEDAPGKIGEFVRYLGANKASLFGGNTFIPFFLYPESVDNLRIMTEGA